LKASPAPASPARGGSLDGEKGGVKVTAATVAK